MVVTGCGVGVLGWGGGGVVLRMWRVSEFWTSGKVYVLIHTINTSTVCLTQFGQKVN